jgi:hypothetical protein
MTTKLDEAERDVVTALLQVAHAASTLLDESKKKTVDTRTDPLARAIAGSGRECLIIVQTRDAETLRAALDVWHAAEDVRAAEMVRALRGDDAPAGVTS